MLKLNWKNINTPMFMETLKKLRENEAKLPIQAKYRLASISQACYFELLKAQAEAQELLKKYAKKDEKGAILGLPDHTKVVFETKELEEKHDNDFRAMLENRFKIDSEPLSVRDLSEVVLTGDELLAIGPILRDSF